MSARRPDSLAQPSHHAVLLYFGCTVGQAAPEPPAGVNVPTSLPPAEHVHSPSLSSRLLSLQSKTGGAVVVGAGALEELDTGTVVLTTEGDGVGKLDAIPAPMVVIWQIFPGPPPGVKVPMTWPFSEQVQRPSLSSRLGLLHWTPATSGTGIMVLRMTVLEGLVEVGFRVVVADFTEEVCFLEEGVGVVEEVFLTEEVDFTEHADEWGYEIDSRDKYDASSATIHGKLTASSS